MLAKRKTPITEITLTVLILLLSATVIAKSTAVDFDKAMTSVNFSLTSDDNGIQGGNGIPDATEMALVAAILADDNLSFKDRGGVDHASVYEIWEKTKASLKKDVRFLRFVYPRVVEINGGYIMVGTEASFAAINKMSAAFGASLDEDYSSALSLGRYLGPEGDADGDGFSNYEEYYVNRDKPREYYIKAALNPDIIPAAEQLPGIPKPKKKLKNVAVLLFPGFEVIDVYGPVGIWGNVPEFKVFTVAEKAGPVLSAQGVASVADFSFEDAPSIDILLVPGGSGARAEINNTTLLDFIRESHKTSELTTTVCSGSALAAKSGILDGHKATSNKYFFSFATGQSDDVEWIERARWVEDGKLFTSSGVSAGTDMALAVVAKLFGRPRATQLANSLEYIWNSQADNDPFVKFIQ